jgi:long-chain acyl-CoA synthetase
VSPHPHPSARPSTPAANPSVPLKPLPPQDFANLFPIRPGMRETQGAMPRQSLLEYFGAESRPPRETAIAWRRGYRMVRWSYAELLRAAGNFATELAARGVAKGDRVLIWGENSGECVAAFLGCLFSGAVAVPMDAIADPGFARRVAEQTRAKLIVADRNVATAGFPAAVIYFEELAPAPHASAGRQGTASAVPKNSEASGVSTPEGAEIRRSDPVEIVFTSGTTAEPRGVVLTHGNLLANLEPLEKEIERYIRFEHIFHPLRFVVLLPLSHVFGQLMGIFLPQILGGTSIYLDTLNPAEALRAIRSERVSVLVTVPRLVDSLRDHLEREAAARGELEKFRADLAAAEGEHFLLRWWRFRKIHSRLGWKFWAIVSGGAALPAEAESFWTRLGYAVIQGYGLTETTSLVSVNHPFRIGHGSIGKSLPGTEVKLAEDGEILVRGENVAAGYWKASGAAPVLDADGWFHTGDLGERDAAGNLFFKGRRKNEIVTSEGLNIFPEDLEAELRKEPGVRDAVVVGLKREGNAEPCAVLLLRLPALDTSADAAAAAVAAANARLAPFQRLRCWFVWPEADFPRTPTQKPALARIREFTEATMGIGTVRATAAGPLAEMVARISRRAPARAGDVALADLSSIERVELLSALEERYQVDLSETEFSNAESATALERLLEAPPAREPVFHYPRWPQTRLARWIRATAWRLFLLPTMLLRGWPRREGRENLRGVRDPVLVVCNHITHLDPAFVFAMLPGQIRRRIAVAMDGERLEALRKPPASARFFGGLSLRIQYWLLLALFNVFPLPKRAGFRKGFSFVGELVDRGLSVLIFPEGELTTDGRMAAFRAGIGLLAANLRIPVVPARIDGLWELKQSEARWARPKQIRVATGAPVEFSTTQTAEEITRELERRVAALAEKKP